MEKSDDIAKDIEAKLNEKLKEAGMQTGPTATEEESEDKTE